MYKIGFKQLLGIFLSLIFLGVMVGGTASAQVYSLCTGQVSLAMPDGTLVDAWGPPAPAGLQSSCETHCPKPFHFRSSASNSTHW